MTGLNRTQQSLILVMIFAWAGLLCGGCGSKDASAAGYVPATPVVTAVAVARDVPVYLDEIGHCVAINSLTVTPRVDGQITKILFADGQEVKTGQALFEIDPRPYAAALHQAQADVAKAQAALDFAKADFARVQGLVKSDAISQEDYDTKQKAVEVDEAQLDAASAEVETAKLNLVFCEIKSPFDGLAGKRMVDVYNIVKSNTTALLSIQQMDPIYAEFTITERDLSAVRQSMSGDQPLAVDIKLPDEEGDGRQGKLVFLDNAVQSSGTVTLRAQCENADRHFWPGQFVRVRVILSIDKGAVLVPEDAPKIGQQGPYVFVVDRDGIAEQRQVVEGQRQGDMIVIDQGLRAGDRVITNGQLMVMPGSKVIDTSAAADAQGDQGGQQ
jgi:multidrug efflux system membrane fusion protein